MPQAFNVRPWFPPAEYEEIKNIYYRHGSLIRISKNTVLKSWGDENRLFYLKKGLCACSVNGYSGKSLIIALLLPGRAVGDLTCVSGETVNMNITAKRGSELLALPSNIITEYMESDPHIGVLMARTVLAKRNSHMEGMLNNSLLPQEDRTRAFFKALINSLPQEGEPPWNRITLKFSNEEIARTINSSRVSVSRILGRWKARGLYKKVNGTIYVHNDVLAPVSDWRR